MRSEYKLQDYQKDFTAQLLETPRGFQKSGSTKKASITKIYYSHASATQNKHNNIRLVLTDER
jgi:hypothetical protein